jgi:branched-chain amino acid transport system permease protein
MEQQIVLGALTMLIAVALPGGLMSLLPQRGWLARPPIWGPPSTALEHAPLAAAQAAVAETSGPGPVLSCRGLSKRFGGVVAVDGVDLHVAPGEVLAVIGPNGAGKSTLFNLLSGFAVPSAGEVIFADRAISGIRPYVLARRGLARTFQTSRLFPTLSVWENVLLAASSRYRRKAQAVAAATELLERVGLREDWARLPQGLPPGRRRLLEIARALALEPSVLLLDEAMAGMTGPEIAQVQQVLRAAVARGSAIIAIEHVLPAIAPLAGRVQVLDFGRTIAEGTPAAVLHDPTVIAAYLGTDMAEAELAHA